MLIELTIVATVVLTSMLSGVLGMAGGIILMALLVALKPVAAAMIIHGVVQATSNGSRAFLLRRHIALRILPQDYWKNLSSNQRLYQYPETDRESPHGG